MIHPLLCLFFCGFGPAKEVFVLYLFLLVFNIFFPPWKIVILHSMSSWKKCCLLFPLHLLLKTRNAAKVPVFHSVLKCSKGAFFFNTFYPFCSPLTNEGGFSNVKQAVLFLCTGEWFCIRIAPRQDCQIFRRVAPLSVSGALHPPFQSSDFMYLALSLTVCWRKQGIGSKEYLCQHPLCQALAIYIYNQLSQSNNCFFLMRLLLPCRSEKLMYTAPKAFTYQYKDHW